jgi:POT family proton-dependent oligopeptide transporter
MVSHFEWNDRKVYALVSSFTAMTYLSPIIGGWIADNLLGQKNTILTGAVCLFFSYSTLTVVTSTFGLLAALAGIAVGTGLLKPNISSLLGNEYPIDSPKRESGFTIFYMGITTGIILGTTLPSQLQTHFGWPASFMSAAIGMIAAISVFALGVKKYNMEDYHPFVHTPAKIVKAALLIIVLWCISFYIMFYPRFADLSFSLVVLFAITYLVNTAWREPSQQARQTIVIGLLCIISIMFWAFYFQMFMSLTLFISRVVDGKLFGILFPPPYYVTVQSLGMLIFGYFISRPRRHATSQNGVSTGNKFLLSMCFMFLSYSLIVYTCFKGNTSPLVLIPAYLLISISELLLSPVGLAAITTLASRRKVSTMMGIFFVSLGIGGFLSGKLAYITAIDPTNLTPYILQVHYMQAFTKLLYILFIATIGCAILNRIIKLLLSKS